MALSIENFEYTNAKHESNTCKIPDTNENDIFKSHKESEQVTKETHRTNTVRFSDRTVLIPDQPEKNKNERKRLFRQRKYFSADTDIESINNAASKETDNKSSLINPRIAPAQSHSAEGRLDTRDEDKNETIEKKTYIELSTVSDLSKDNRNNEKTYTDNLMKPEITLSSEQLERYPEAIQTDLTVDDSRPSSAINNVEQSSLSNESSLGTPISEQMFGHRPYSFEWVPEESDSDSDLSVSDKINVLSISDSDEYDTDLEIDPNFGKEPAIDVTDRNICKNVYLKYCKRWGIVPQKAFLDGLTYRSLSLRNRSLGGTAIAPVCKALKDNLRVERVNLDGTDITDAGSRHVAEMLLDNICISRVNLSNNNLGLQGAQLLGHVMAVTRYITHLNLSDNKFDDTCAWFLSDGISTNTTLESLDMSHNNFEYISGKLIGKALVINKKLKTLDLSWNKLCGKGSVSIFHALMFNKTLETLNISWNGIGYEGSVALSKCFKKNESLKEIDVSNNRISWLGAPLIAVGLKKNGVLKRLKIGYNPLTTSGCMDLLEAASAETNGLSLLDATEICVVGEADLLAATISRRRKFTFLHGRILPTHDKLGVKQGREINPMVRIIEYLRLLGLRPLELMKSFHKTASYELPRKEFVDQIKKIGVKLHPHEIEALANSISAKGYDRNLINYRKLAVAVREVVDQERQRKIREREEWRQIRTYHEKILRRGTLTNIPIPRSGSLDAREKDSIAVSALLTPLSSSSSMKSRRASKTLSLCAPLDSTGSRSKAKSKKRARMKTIKKN